MAHDLSQIHNVNREAVDELLRRYSQASVNFKIADVLLANAEFLARIIVSTSDTPITGIQMAQVMEEHMKRGLQVGFEAKGFNFGGALESGGRH